MQVLVSRKESDIHHRDEVIEESEHLLAPRRRFPPAAVAMGSSDMNEVVRVTTPHNDEVEMMSDFLSCQDRSHDPSLLISYSTLVQVWTMNSTKFILLLVSLRRTWATVRISGERLEKIGIYQTLNRYIYRCIELDE
jgi:hypothetical protein